MHLGITKKPAINIFMLIQLSAKMCVYLNHLKYITTALSRRNKSVF